MFNVGGGELLVVLLIALMVLGPDRLPGFAKKAGKVMGDIRRVSQGFQTEIRQAMDLDDDKPKQVPPAAPRLVEPPTPPGSVPLADAAPAGPGSTASGSTGTGTPPPATAPDTKGDEPASGTSAA